MAGIFLGFVFKCNRHWRHNRGLPIIMQHPPLAGQSVNGLKPVTTCWRQIHGRDGVETGSESWLGLSVTGGVGTKQPDDVSMGGGDGTGDGQRSDP